MRPIFGGIWMVIGALLGTSAVAQLRAAGNGGLAVVRLQCERSTNPLGLDTPAPQLSWVLGSSERGQRQTAYQVLVASSPEKLAADEGELWDSGKVGSSLTYGIAYEGQRLASSEQVFWKVRCWDRDGVPSAWSGPATWTMGILGDADWQARWIRQPVAAAFNEPRGLPIFRKAFSLDRPVRRALVHVSGLGHYELFLNGARVGDRFLDPAWSVYEKTVYATTYDITDALRAGDNVFGVMLGKGFYNTAGDRRIHGVQAERPLKLILQAHIECGDGSEITLLSDHSWRVTDGPITHCAILGGSDYDARRLPAGWLEPGFDDERWSRAEETEGPGGRLRSSLAPPMKVMEVFDPVGIEEPEPGIFVYDFGQNASAVPSLRIRGRAGQTVRLTPAEQRFDQSERSNDGRGRVNQAGVGKPNYWEYTLGGGPNETWTPQFTYGGFQYLELTGGVPAGRPNPQELPVVESLVSRHVRNAAATVGAFSCSNPLLNDIHRLIDWAVRSNLGHVLTDCPHREKLGWLEVSYLMEPSIACRYDIANFYRKVTRDIRDSQDDNGAIYTVAPNYPSFSGGFRYTPEWGAAGVILPWQVYQRSGDPTVLQDNFTAMRRFVDYLNATSTDLVPVAGLGDWYDYGHGQGNGPARFTPPELTAMATFYLCADIVARSADVLERPDEGKQYAGLANRIREALNGRYFDAAAGVYRNHGSPQTANAMALVTGLVPAESVEAVVKRLVADLRARDHQQTAGDIGFSYLVQALSEHGRHDVLFEISQRRELGSYGYIRDGGWTSLPEAWDANTSASMNHCMLGHLQQWFYQDLAGIRRDPNGTAFERIVLRPQIVGDLTWVKANHESVNGRIASAWQRQGSVLTLDISIPVNTSARVEVPSAAGATVTENGRPVDEAPGVRRLGFERGCTVLEIGSGTYRFVSRLP